MRVLFPLLVTAGFVMSTPVFALDAPASPPAEQPLKNFVTSVEKDGSITFRLFAPAAKAVSVGLGSRDPLVMQKAEDVYKRQARHIGSDIEDAGTREGLAHFHAHGIDLGKDRKIPVCDTPSH